jgi:hypothetical protein
MTVYLLTEVLEKNIDLKFSDAAGIKSLAPTPRPRKGYDDLQLNSWLNLNCEFQFQSCSLL